MACDENGLTCFAVGVNNKSFSTCITCGLKWYVNRKLGVCALCWPKAVREKSGWNACNCPGAMAAMKAAQDAKLKQNQAQQMSQSMVAAGASTVPPDREPQEAAAPNDGNLMIKLDEIGSDMKSISTMIDNLGSDAEKKKKALDAKTKKLDNELCSMNCALEQINARLSQLEDAQEEIVSKCAELGQLHDPTLRIQEMMDKAMEIMTIVLDKLENMGHKMQRAKLISSGELEAVEATAPDASDNGADEAGEETAPDASDNRADDAWQMTEREMSQTQ